jgi:hypothetical protein
MGAWRRGALRRIGRADELQIAPVRRSGDLRAPTTTWGARGVKHRTRCFPIKGIKSNHRVARATWGMG